MAEKVKIVVIVIFVNIEQTLTFFPILSQVSNYSSIDNSLAHLTCKNFPVTSLHSCNLRLLLCDSLQLWVM